MRGGRGQILGLRSDDPVLNSIGPIGLALAAGSALVIDLVGDGGPRSLADIRDDGPRLDELSPGRTGVAIIGAGPISGAELRQVIESLAPSWPAVVVRSDGSRWDGPTVPYQGVYPGQPPKIGSPGVWQVAPGAGSGRFPGVVMPDLRRRLVVALLKGEVPAKSRWVSAWRRVWELPWA